jgi:S1-C subfamily serine protease
MDTETPQTPEIPAPAARPRRRWRAAAAGALAGGVLAASVAVPLTWRVVAAEHQVSVASAATGATTTTTETWPVPGTGTRPEWNAAGGGPDDETTTATDTDATEAQSTGVVLIETVTASGEAAGTGLVLDADGTVVTNYHVVEGATEVTVTVATTGETYQAEVLGADPESDIAVLRLDGASDLDVVDLDDDGAALDETVTAVGNAEGQGYLSASAGTVTALEQSITTSAEYGIEGEDLAGLIETDAYVVGGYSGGALLDDEGEVVGITTAASSGTAVTESYAVPIDDALAVVDQVESGVESGSVRIGAAAYLGVAVDDDLLVASVETGTAAAEAGIEAGATLVALDGTAVSGYDALAAVLDGLEPGDRVGVRWTDADGTSHRATITLGASPAA